ncbi:MAG TPA: hypothetical protein VF931_06710 [Steroidobacteraceae bacterium]
MSHNESTAVTGNFDLMLQDRGAPVSTGSGYDPYDTWPSVRTPGSSAKQADLRRLSEWISLRRQVSQLKKSDS